MMDPSHGDSSVDPDLLVAYLLGTLPADEIERLDERSITDDEFAWRLRAAEDDLVDAYVRGELSGAALLQFRAAYLGSPDRAARVRFAEGLQAVAARPRRSRSRMLPAWGLAAAAALIAAAGLVYVVVENQRLRREVAATAAARQAAERSAESVQAELDHQRSLTATLQDELRRLRDSMPRVRAPSLPTFLLLPMRRSGGEISSVRIPRGAAQVRFRLRLEPDDFARYVASLRDPATGRIVWRSGPLVPQADGAARSLEVEIPAGTLTSQAFTIDVASATDAAAIVGSYAFRVVFE